MSRQDYPGMEIDRTVDITPYTVTFDAGDGKVNGQQTITLTGQYRYPSLHDYVAVPNDAKKLFICWTDKEGKPVTDQSGQLLNGDVTYYARYKENITFIKGSKQSSQITGFIKDRSRCHFHIDTQFISNDMGQGSLT